MKTHKGIIFTAATSFLAVGLMVAIVANGDGNYLGFTATEQQYTLTLSEANGGSGFANSYSSSEATNTLARTTSGAEVDIKYQDAKQSSGYYVDLKANGYFYNTDNSVVQGIKGIESIKVTYTGSTLSLYTNDTASFGEEGQTLTSGTPVTLDGTDNYFKVLNTGGNAALISSVEVKYSCVATPKAFYKVQDTSEVTSGQYLIVYEDTSKAFNGSRSTLDGNGNYASVTISNETIASNSTTNAYSFYINVGTTTTIKSYSGHYIGKETYANGLDEDSSTQYENTITVKEGEATITASSGTTLRYNTSYGFRYYKSGQQPIALYRRSGGSAAPVEPTTPVDPTEPIVPTEPTEPTEPTTTPTGSSVEYSITIEKTNSGLTTTASTSEQTKSYTLSDNSTSLSVKWGIGAYNLSNFDEFRLNQNSYLKSNSDLKVSRIVVDYYSGNNNIYYTVSANGSTVTGTDAGTHVLDYSINSSIWEINASSGYQAFFSITIYVEIYVGPVAVTGVSLNKTNLALYTGASESLVATVAPSGATNKNVTWSTSNSAIADVDQTGLVTATGNGTATITVTTEDGSFTATCTVTVTTYVSVTSVSVSPTSKTIEKGGSVTLTATVNPSNATNKNVTWSSNSACATVNSSGVVTGVSAGTATITVTTVDGGKTATSTITINPTAVSGVSLDQSAISLTVGQSQTLVATVTPQDADNKNVTWSSDKPSVATVTQNGTVTAAGEGEAIITVTTQDGSKTAQCSVNVTKSTTPVVGVTVFEKVTSVSDLSAGSYILIGCESKGKVAGSLSSQILGSVAGTFSNNQITLGSSMLVLKLGGTSGAWTLENTNGEKLGATAVKKLAWDSGTTTWDISISGGSATIQNGTESYGRFMYNVNDPRFTTYTSSVSSTMLLPEIYIVTGKVTGVSLNASDIGVTVGGTYNLSATVTPDSAENKNVTWSSSNTANATVNSNGVVTGVKAGTTATITAASAEDESIYATCLVRVQSGSTVVPSVITLDTTSATLNTNDTLQLNATVKPENAANKNINWTSSNTTIATVSSSGLVTAKKASNSPVTITARSAANNSVYATCSVTVTEEVIADWTIMIYMCGSNLESGSDYSTNTPTINTNPNNADGYASSDLDEILSASGQTSKTNIIVQTGGATVWQSGHSYSISNSVNERWHVSNKSLVKDASLTDLNMGDKATFSEFLQWGLTSYKAQKTAVIMWDHGGAMYGVGMDEKHDLDEITNYEAKQALDSAFSATNRTQKLEWIGYDACLMAVQDIAEFNSHYFNYMVASQESEWAGGWDYQPWVELLYTNPSTSSLLKEIVDSFIESMGGATQSGKYNTQTLAYYNLSYAEEYLNAWEDMSEALYNNLDSKSNFKSLVTSCKYYGDDDYVYFGIFDAKDFLNKLKNNSKYYSGLSSYVSAVETAFSHLVEYNLAQKNAGNSNGLCLVYVNSSSYPMTNYYNNNNTNFRKWRKINIDYGYLGGSY